LVTAGESCCEQTSFEYTVNTQYAYPLSQTRGSATDPFAQVKTSTTYDFNTGLVLSVTDANGRISQTNYFANTIRPQTVSRSSGAHTDYAYDDVAMSVTETSYLESHPTHTTTAQQNVKYLNGRGGVRQEKALGASGVWDFVDVVYDSMGQVSQQSRPYRTGDTVQWSTSAYDALGRPISLTLPDGSITQTFFNETSRPAAASSAPGETMRVRDAWGRERWGRTDSQNRLVEVVEPVSTGSGSVFDAGALATTYTYDTLGNLTATNQGGQIRSFKYDSLGRLTAQKLAETSATLNDTGQYVGSGTWGDVFTYDTRSNLVSRTDARGVKTVYNYNSDPLNRLQSISWDTSGFGDTGNPILAAPTVTYQYRTKSTGSQLLDITQLSSVTTSGVSTESYGYDTEGRTNSKTLTLTSRPSYPFVTDYIYDSLDRISDLRYPAEYGNGTQPRKLVHYSYDVASRLTSLTVDGASHASNVVYNPDSQTTSLGVGAAGANQIIESYNFDPQTGLLASQTLARSSTPTTWLLNLSYDYAGTNGKRTGQLVKLLNNLNHNKDRVYSYDALGRLAQAKGGPATGSPLWTQTYGYDRYGNRTTVSASGVSASLIKQDSSPAVNSHHASPSPQQTIPVDGHSILAYAATTNRITTAGFAYDAAGNQVRALIPGGGSQRFQYDAANRLVKVKADDNVTVIGSYTYGSSSKRLIKDEGGIRTYFACGANVEYSESGASTTPVWSKSYIYFGPRLLSTLTPNGGGGELVQYHHPDRLGARIVTNAQDTTQYEQVSLPFGTALAAESSGATNKRFTTYDRSTTTGLDYALNRHYDPQQGRFMQVDPAGMQATSLEDPQTLNLYAYCSNDPINNIDPDGLGLFSFLKKVFNFVVKVIKVIAAVVAFVNAVATIIVAPHLTFLAILTFIATTAKAISDVLDVLGLTKASKIFGIISAVASFGASVIQAAARTNWKTILKAISDGATLTSKTLTELGQTKLAKLFELAASATKFLSDGLKVDDAGKSKWVATGWDTYKFIRKMLEEVATLAGATRVAAFLNALGLVDDAVSLRDGARSLLKSFKTSNDNSLRTWSDRLKTVQGMVGNINSMIGRVDKVVALAN
jgi:RHS repeat-associated protein